MKKMKIFELEKLPLGDDGTKLVYNSVYPIRLTTCINTNSEGPVLATRLDVCIGERLDRAKQITVAESVINPNDEVDPFQLGRLLIRLGEHLMKEKSFDLD